MEISSRKNPEIVKLVSLKDKKYRDEYGLYLAEGEKSVREAVKFGAEIVAVIGTGEKVQGYVGGNFKIITVTRQIADYCCDSVTPQGIVAVIKKPENRLIAPLYNAVLLDNVQDPGNVGAIIRTMVALGIKDVYTVNCADPYSPKAVRASMSGIFNVSVHDGTYDEVFNCLNGVTVISGDMTGENVFTYKPSGKFCLAIGSEGKGLSERVRTFSDAFVKIPMSDKMESLNAGVSASVLLYQLSFNQNKE